MEPHELDVISLTAGIIFLVLGMAHMIGIDVTRMAFHRLWPMLLIVGGGVLLVGVIRRARDE